MPIQSNASKRVCTLLLFVATPAEEAALAQAAKDRGLHFEKIKDRKLGEYHWLGAVGNETVIAIRPIREHGRVVMGSLGRLGSAARGIRFQEATGACGIVQLGMAFGLDPRNQQPGDVLVAVSLIPYDNRDVRPAPNGQGYLAVSFFEPGGPLFSISKRPKKDPTGYVMDYTQANRQPARPALIELFRREQRRGGHSFGIHVGSMLSGAARIHSARFRDELVRSVPAGDDPIVGGEMEGVGLLAASTAADDPIWCVVKGVSDFADENRDAVIDANRPLACHNAAEFVLSALVRDAER